MITDKPKFKEKMGRIFELIMKAVFLFLAISILILTLSTLFGGGR